jgi:hypothetical protein
VVVMPVVMVSAMPVIMVMSVLDIVSICSI